MYESMRASRGSLVMKTFTAIYYVTWIFIGNFILLNLFLAILIDSFNSEESENQANEKLAQEAEYTAKQLSLERLRMQRVSTKSSLQSFKTWNAKRQTSKVLNKNSKSLVHFTGRKQLDDLDLIEDLDELHGEEITNMLKTNNVVNIKKQKDTNIKIPASIECENSIYLFNRRGWIRKMCYYVQQHRYFNRFIMVLIALSSLQLAFETYIQDVPEDDAI